ARECASSAVASAGSARPTPRGRAVRFAALTDLEGGGEVAAGRLALVDARGFGGGRAVVERGEEAVQGVARAGGEHLAGRVRPVGAGAEPAELAGPPPRPPSEARALDAAVDAERAAWLGRLSHGVGSGVAGVRGPARGRGWSR